MYPVQLDGERIQLRDFEPTDLDAMMAVSGDPEVTSYLSFDTRTRDQQALLLAADIERAQAEPRPDYYLAIIEKSTGALVGFVRIGLLAHSAGELGYAMRRDRWRRGYTTEASGVMLDFAFTTLGLHRVQAACGPENAGSQALLEKLGFSREGRLRDHVFTNGAWRDSLLYSIMDREWHSASRDIGQ
jgi:[ribosomal protein S5]-alanine N-acetyltransferase